MPAPISLLQAINHHAAAPRIGKLNFEASQLGIGEFRALAVCQNLSNLRSLNIRSNHLDQQSIDGFCRMLAEDPSRLPALVHVETGTDRWNKQIAKTLAERAEKQKQQVEAPPPPDDAGDASGGKGNHAAKISEARGKTWER